MSGVPNDPGSMRVAAVWTARMTTVLAELAAPALVGGWIDRTYGTSFGMLAGLAVGVPLAMWHLIRMVQRDDSYKGPPSATDGTTRGDEKHGPQ